MGGYIISFSFKMQEEDEKYSIFFEKKIEITNQHHLKKQELLALIIKNNLTIVISSIVLGCLSFGILSLLVTFYNGFVLGYIIQICIQTGNSYLIFTKIFPHSIEEIGIILSGVIGCYYGKYLYYELINNKKHILQKDKKLINYVFLPACIIIIVIAGFLEVYVSIK